MPRRTMLCCLIAAGVGWFVRGATGGRGVVAPAVAAAHRYAVPQLHCPAPARTEEPGPDDQGADEPVAPDDEVAPDDDSQGDDVGDLLAKANLALHPPNGIHGQVTDSRNGDGLAGVTVILTSPDVPATSSVTNEDGAYAFEDLAAGSYSLMFYYASQTIERDNITVSSFDSTDVSQRIDPDAEPPRDLYTYSLSEDESLRE